MAQLVKVACDFASRTSESPVQLKVEGPVRPSIADGPGRVGEAGADLRCATEGRPLLYVFRLL